jgi:RHS repeat-associated protein
VEYDALGRVKRSSPSYRAAAGAALFSTDRWAETAYDALGRVVTVTTRPDNAAVTTSYSGNRVTVTDQAGKVRRSLTDALGRLTRVDEPNSSGALDVSGSPAQPTYYTYDVIGNLRKVEQGGQFRFFLYDSLGRLIRARYPEQGVNSLPVLADPLTGNSQWSAAYAYDGNGNLTSRTDARNVTTSYAYDSLGRSTTVSYAGETGPPTPSVKRTYDGATNGKGLAWHSYSGGDEATGTTVQDTVIDSYDVAGRPLTQRQRFKTGGVWSGGYQVQRTYDLVGNVKTQTYPSGRVASYTTDVMGRPASFTGNLGDGVQRSYSTNIDYDELGGMRQERFGTQTPLYSKRAYNSRGQLSALRLSTYSAADPDPLNQLNYDRGLILNYYGGAGTADGADNNGNLRRQTIKVPSGTTAEWVTTLVYEYDTLNRLDYVREAQGGADLWKQDYDYDRWGNRTVNAANTQVYGPNSAYTIPEKQLTASTTTNRIAPPAGFTMSYDAAGNLTYDNYTGEGARTFDAESRITSAQFVSGQLQTASYAYDAGGRRVKRDVGVAAEVWQVYGFGGELLAEYGANAAAASPQKEYGYRGGELLVTAEPGAQVRWLVTDHLGTPRMVVDKTGALAGVVRHDYLPFGEELTAGVGGRTTANGYGADGVRQKFTGHERDGETELDFAQARYYAAAQGRFTSPDPLFMAAERLPDPQQLNIYTYARNNPLKYTDPSGLDITIDGSRKDEYLKYLREKLSFKIESINNKVTVVDAKGNALGKDALAALGKTLKGGEAELFKAITDTQHHAVIDTGGAQSDDGVNFGRNDQASGAGPAGRNTLDLNEIALLDAPENAGGLTGADVVAHETLEAYASSQGQSFNDAHDYASKYFGEIRRIPNTFGVLGRQEFGTGVYRKGTLSFDVLRPDKRPVVMRTTLEFTNGFSPKMLGTPQPFNIIKVELVP